MIALKVGFQDAAQALARFGFGDGADGSVRVACTRLAGPPQAEVWGSDTAIEQAEREGAHWWRTPDLGMVRIEVDERDGDIEAAGHEAYRRLLAAVRPSSHPYLIRIWNYLDAINQGEGDAERYRRFCVGRAAAVDAAFLAPPPAATAIGVPQSSGRLQVIALCARTPAIALENPRQTPAWQYPREFGPVSPGFSRGALLGEGAAMRLLASGTASIVGHVSQHPEDALAQLRESLVNLEVLLQQGTQHSGRQFDIRTPDALRVYLRRPADLAAVQSGLDGRIAPERIVFLHGDICRRELLVELEGVFTAQ